MTVPAGPAEPTEPTEPTEPNELYPFTGKYLDIGGLNYHYLDEGSGEPVVMVHGNPSWSFYYRNLVLALRGSFRTIVPDHIGCGLSDKPDDSRYRYTLASRVENLTALLDSVVPDERLTLVVHDWGGMIGLAWAVRHPEQVRRIVVLNTAAFHLPAGKPFPWPLRLVRTALGAFLVRGFNAFSRIASRVACTRKRLSSKVRDAYCAPYDSWANRIATLRFVQDIPLRPGDQAYNVVTEVELALPIFGDHPLLICWGERDFVFDRHFLAEWIRVWPKAKVHRFADCGHYVLEDAGDEIIELIQSFLSEGP